MTIVETSFFCLGLGALGSLFLALFTALGDGPPKLHSASPLKLSDENFFDVLESALDTPSERGGTAKILNNGDEFFPALTQAIESAEASINIMVFIWVKGVLGDPLVDALIAKAKAGVEVRLLLDALGCLFCNKAKMRELRAAGGQVVFFRPFRFGIIHRYHRRNHSRAFVIDGRLAFTGGMAVEHRWLGHGQDRKHWRDLMVQVTGPLARGLQTVFATVWCDVVGDILSGDKTFPDFPDQEGPRFVSVMSSPAYESHPARKFFWISCAAAEKSIDIRNAYFVPGKIVTRLLADKARQGVRVRLILPNHFNDQKFAYFAGRAFYDELLRAGVHIYEYQRTMIHAKTILVDNAWSVFGSANLDIRSHVLNEENLLGLMDTKFGGEHRENFEADLRDCQELTLSSWRRRAWPGRVLEWICGLVAQQL